MVLRIADVVMMAAVGRTAWLAVLSGRYVNLAVSESRMTVAIVADKNFLGVNRASVTVAAHVGRIGWCITSASPVRVGVGDGGVSQKGERTEGDGDDSFFHGCVIFCYASFDPCAGRLFTFLPDFF